MCSFDVLIDIPNAEIYKFSVHYTLYLNIARSIFLDFEIKAINQ